MKFLKNRKTVLAAFGVLIISAIIMSWGLYAKPVHAALVGYSTMVNVAPDIYIEPGLSKDLQEELLNYVNLAEGKVSAVFGERSSTPYLIVALSSRILDKYAENPVGQTYYLPSHQAFLYGSPEAATHYNLACYEVTKWFNTAGREGLLRLIEALNQGQDFAEQYAMIEGRG